MYLSARSPPATIAGVASAGICSRFEYFSMLCGSYGVIDWFFLAHISFLLKTVCAQVFTVGEGKKETS